MADLASLYDAVAVDMAAHAHPFYDGCEGQYTASGGTCVSRVGCCAC